MQVTLNVHCVKHTGIQSLIAAGNPECSTQYPYITSQTLRLACWNIKGFCSRVVGNKLMDPDFLSEINGTDILGLSETHIYDEILDKLDIPGFSRVGYKNRKKIKNINKTSGGLAIFAKDSIAKKLELFKTSNNDVIWIKLDKKHHELSNDVYIGSVYVSGENNTKSINDKIKNLSDDIELIKKKKGDIIFQGDFDARTSNTNDFVDYDKHDVTSEVDIIEHPDLPPRSSADLVTNANGKEVLDLCKTYNLCIINGRKTGDHLGNFTSFQPGGNSIIDYTITSQNLFPNVLTFEVGEFLPWISDHCPIHYTIDIGKPSNGEGTDDSILSPLPATWYWDEKSEEKFTGILESNDFKNKIDLILAKSDGDEIANDLNLLMTNAAGSCGLSKKTKNKKTEYP